MAPGRGVVRGGIRRRCSGPGRMRLICALRSAPRAGRPRARAAGAPDPDRARVGAAARDRRGSRPSGFAPGRGAPALPAARAARGREPRPGRMVRTTHPKSSAGRCASTGRTAISASSLPTPAALTCSFTGRACAGRRSRRCTGGIASITCSCGTASAGRRSGCGCWGPASIRRRRGRAGHHRRSRCGREQQGSRARHRCLLPRQTRVRVHPAGSARRGWVVHISRLQRSDIARLHPGDRVEFERIRGHAGWEAVRPRLIAPGHRDGAAGRGAGCRPGGGRGQCTGAGTSPAGGRHAARAGALLRLRRLPLVALAQRPAGTRSEQTPMAAAVLSWDGP